MKKRATILTIAGFDPSGGAGVLADVKTVESHGCIGMAVQTANTVQTEDTFKEVNWLPAVQIKSQLHTLLGQYVFNGVKIGLIESLDLLSEILSIIRESSPKTIIVWDPVLSASAGFDFEHNLAGLKAVLQKVDWVTPNWNEAIRLSNNSDAMSGSAALSEYAYIYLKGGHNESEKGKDYLWKNGAVISFNPKFGNYFEKHGSGCVFSAALTANLTKGYPKQKAILKSKRYIEQFLKSNKTLLGYHK